MIPTIQVNFGPLYSIGQLNDEIPGIDQPGVYIWGFVFEKDLNEEAIGSPLEGNVDNKSNEHIFIPYYVGQSSKLSVFTCFKRHKNPNKNKLYTVLSNDYLKKFFNDPAFPENIGKNANSTKEERDWFWYPKHAIGPDYFKGKIIYHNNHLILKHLYDLDDLALPHSTAYPFTDLIQTLMKASHPEAASIGTHGNDFFKKMYFCFTSNPNTSEINRQFTLKDWEAFTFYRLKGKTISQHNSYKSVKEKFAGIQVHMTAAHGEIFKPVMSNVFKCRY